MKKFVNREEIARWQYRRRQRLKWLRRLPVLLSFFTALAAGLTLSGLSAQLGLWLTFTGAVLSFFACFIPQDERSREQRVNQEYLDKVRYEFKKGRHSSGEPHAERRGLASDSEEPTREAA